MTFIWNQCITFIKNETSQSTAYSTFSKRRELSNRDGISGALEQFTRRSAWLCPAGSIERPLFYLEEFYDWSHIFCKKELFLKMLEHYHAHIVEKIAGLEILLSDMSLGNEAHTRTHIHNVLSQGSHGYLSEVDKQKKDIHALSRGKESLRDIHRHFDSLFTPFHFGEHVLEFFQDKRFFKILGNVNASRLSQDLFMDDCFQAFRIDRFIRCLGEGFISFHSPHALRKQLWTAHIRMHRFSQLHNVLQHLSKDERKAYWGETIGIRRTCLEYVLKEASNDAITLLHDEIKREIATFSPREKEILLKKALSSQDKSILDRLIIICGRDNILNILNKSPLEFLYQCLRYGSLNTLKSFLSLPLDLTKIYLRRLLTSCLHNGLKGLDMLQYLCHHSFVSFPKTKRYFMSDGKSLLSTVIVFLKEEWKIFPYLHYLIDTVGFSPTLTDETPSSFTPLHWACLKGHLSIVKWLIEVKKVPPNYCQEGRKSAISQAALAGHKNILEYLNKKGVSLTLADKTPSAFTPFHWACLKGHLSIIKWLIETQKVSPHFCPIGSLSPIGQAALGGQKPVLQYLIEECGVPPTLKDRDKYKLTPLHWACQKGHLPVVKWLIENQGVDPNYCKKGNLTAIGQAALGGHKDVIIYLEKCGVPLNSIDRDKHEFPPFNWACYGGHLPLVKWFIEEKGADPRHCQNKCQSALSQATIGGHQHILEYLHKKGAPLTLEDKTDEAFTPLHWACQEGHLSIVKWLVEKKRITFNFEEFIKIAIHNNHVAIVEFFVLDTGFPVTDNLLYFLKKHGRTHTLKILKKIETLSGFLENGYNPF